MGTQDSDKWIIEAEGVGRCFGHHEALSRIDLQIGRGEIFGILGPDGAGKTTLMQLLAAILDPTAGRCRVLGFDTVRDAAQVTARIGYMSQGFTLYDRLSVDENLAFSARIRSVPDALFQQRRKALLQMAGLESACRREARVLSGGMRKKLSLCTNLIHEPSLLLLDELSLGVDPVSRRDLWRMLRTFRAQGTTIVLTTPYMDEASYCDRLAFLHQGQLLAVDSPDALKERARGQVYEVVTARQEEVQQLTGEYREIVSGQWLADRFRLQLASGKAPSEPLRHKLEALGAFGPAAPDLENTFVQLTAPPTDTGSTPEQTGFESVQVDGTDAITARGISVRFGNFSALKNLSFRVAAGEVIGWLGPNGAGKTTLIRVLCGLQRPSAGEVHIAGVALRSAPMAVRARIGYMSQHFSLYPDLSVIENLVFFAGLYGLSRHKRRDAVHWVKTVVGIEGIDGRQAGDLSGALRQRLALACAIMHRPAVLFLDEPTSGVDPLARRRFWQLIQLLARAGMAVLVSTHYLEEAYYCHRLGLMNNGRLIALGTLGELRSALETPLHTADMETLFMTYMARASADEGAIT
ncbi:ABC transporter ATP-binding protein [Marinobacterium zhoushanense]|uniref:ABC transporter ATP-binding protein n=1 Tax=Marinobacterium zhoushanense TaxID=1679163 RepID=A0ABQ1KD95_9GAMM|nr:ATP-binding cassette domain-containing protein [Marinobacterium zhoushanense]GGB92436.1 ABC transporter ATP-binding protein [Marinobacterium zhoushanense]